MDFKWLELISIVVAITATVISLVVSYKYMVRSMGMGKRANKGNYKETTDKKTDETKAKEADDLDTDDDKRLQFDEKSMPLDPLEYCEHIHGEVKRVQNKVKTRKIQETMTKEQIQQERDTQTEQLEAIYKLMSQQNEKFGIDTMDEVQEQMKLYA